MTAPKRFGGFEADFFTQCEVLAEVARGCPSASWAATILSAMSWLVAGFPDEAQEEIFDKHDPRVSGVFSPTGNAVRKNGGYVVNGRWGYNTGGHGGEWTVINAVLIEDGVAGMPHCCLVRSKRARTPRRLARERHGRHGEQHGGCKRYLRARPPSIASAGARRRALSAARKLRRIRISTILSRPC